MLPEQPSALQDFQQTHTQAELLMYTKHEIHHINADAKTPAPQPDTCNCRKKPDSPLEGKCLQTNVIYQATVTTETTTETYVGLAKLQGMLQESQNILSTFKQKK